MLNATPPRPMVISHVAATLPGRALRTWTAVIYNTTGYVAEAKLFPTWREALNYANQKAQEQK